MKDNGKDILSKIFLDYYDDLIRFAKRFEQDEDLIKDLIQDLFLKLWKGNQLQEENANIKAYLFKSLRNIWINQIRKKRINTEFSDNLEETFIYQNEDFSANEEIDERRKKTLLDVLNQLPEKQRESIYLKYFQGFDIEEIAEILNMNRQSVRNNLYRAMTKLRENMILHIFLSLL